MAYRFDIAHVGGLPISLEDLTKMFVSQQQQINVLAMSLQKFQYVNETEQEYTAVPFICFGMTEVVPPAVGGNLELWEGFFMTANGELIKVDHCDLSIPTELTDIYIEVVESVAPFGTKVLEDTGANVNCIFERKGVIKHTPSFSSLPSSTEAYLIYQGAIRKMKRTNEVISELLNQ